MRLAWTSDIHLNHVNLNAWDSWVNEICNANAESLVITGDLSESEDVLFQLRRIAETIGKDIFFVLGNHDFYGSSIASTRRNVSSLAREVSSLCYLTDSMPIELGQGCFLVGEDGWGDGRHGDFEQSPVRLNDFQLIKDFQRVDPIDWPRLMQEQGKESSNRLRRKLRAIPASARRAIVATHVPPFRESCWYEGRTTDDFWAPFFVCGHVGDVLMDFASERPEVETVVLCGHTHHGGTATLCPNLVVHTASADYGAPKLERVIEI